MKFLLAYSCRIPHGSTYTKNKEIELPGPPTIKDVRQIEQDLAAEERGNREGSLHVVVLGISPLAG
jgi:hypothetical protein